MRKPKPAPVHATHARYGQCDLLAIRELDGGVLVADVRFDDGAERTIQLDQRYWASPVVEMLPPAPKKRAKKTLDVQPAAA
jgi:hypothetical protein